MNTSKAYTKRSMMRMFLFQAFTFHAYQINITKYAIARSGMKLVIKIGALARPPITRNQRTKKSATILIRLQSILDRNKKNFLMLCFSHELFKHFCAFDDRFITGVNEKSCMQYDLELDKVEAKIKAENAKIVCIQLPEGLRPNAKEIVQELEKRTAAKVIIWLGSCWGACDLPLEVNRLGVDLLVQWGHSEWGH